MNDLRNKKLHLKYPCAWLYKIIGTDADALRTAVAEIIQDRSCKIDVSRQSETAKYISLNVEVIVESESHRTTLYEAFKAHKAIKIVL